MDAFLFCAINFFCPSDPCFYCNFVKSEKLLTFLRYFVLVENFSSRGITVSMSSM